jgi:hypothetical protein
MKDLDADKLRMNFEAISELTNEIRQFRKILEPELRKTETVRRLKQHREDVILEGKQFLKKLAEEDARKDQGKKK